MRWSHVIVVLKLKPTIILYACYNASYNRGEGPSGHSSTHIVVLPPGGFVYADLLCLSNGHVSWY